VTFSEGKPDHVAPLLEIELMEIANGCLARFSGDLVSETAAGVWSIEPMLANEARVALDVSGVTSIDGSGLEAALRLMHAVHTCGGTVTFGTEDVSRDLGDRLSVSPPDESSTGMLGRLNLLHERRTNRCTSGETQKREYQI
jgi:ABC-type transporter Mla MlaB component